MRAEIKKREGVNQKKVAQKLGLRTDPEKILDNIEDKLEKSGYNVNVLTETEREIASMRLGVPVTSIESKKLREMWEKSKS